MDWLLAALALFAVFSVTLPLVPRPIRHGLGTVITIFTFSVLATEIAWLWFLLQAAIALVLIGFGALASGLGKAALAILVASWLALAWFHRQGARLSREAVESGLREGLGDDYRERIPPASLRRSRSPVPFADWRNPVGYPLPGVERIADIPYLPGKGIRHCLDVYRPTVRPPEGCPVLLQIHGGAWMVGHKAQQALPLMYTLASRGWICVSANYRLSPSVGFPAHLEDCKAALCWIREHGAEYGMNPAFVAVTGGSAGGHLAALMGLTENVAMLQPTHPGVDTSVQACVPVYGNYDFITPHDHLPDPSFYEGFLTRNVMHVSPQDDPKLWELASPITRVHADAPPFMIIHGRSDSLIPVRTARRFSRRLREVSRNPVVYVEVPGAEHSFEMFRSVRTEYFIDGVHRFLEWVRADAAGRAAAAGPASAAPTALGA